jgi:hypothetical protein
MPILHQDLAREAERCLFAGMLASQMGFQICRVLMSYFGVPVAMMEVYGWIPRIVRRRRRRGGFFDVIFSSDAHAAIRGPFTVKCSSNNRPSRRATARTVSKPAGHGMSHQPLAVLTEAAVLKVPLIQT